MIGNPSPKRVTHQQLMNKLENELLRLHDATSYRKKTAAIALNIAGDVKDVDIFLEEAATMRQIEKLLPEVDEERRKDVAKYLTVVTRDIVLLASLPPTMRKRIEQRMKNKLTMNKVLH